MFMSQSGHVCLNQYHYQSHTLRYSDIVQSLYNFILFSYINSNYTKYLDTVSAIGYDDRVQQDQIVVRYVH